MVGSGKSSWVGWQWWPYLWGAVYVGLSVVIGLSVGEVGQRFDVDSSHYVNLADWFLNNGLFVPAWSGLPSTCFGYSVFIALARGVYDSLMSVVALQVLLGLCVVLLTHRLARIWFGPRAAFVAVVFAACNIGLLTYPQMFLMDMFVCFLLTITFERLSTFFQMNSMGALGAGGLVLGLVHATRPLGFFYLPLVLVFIYVLSSLKVSRKHSAAILFCVAFGLPVVGVCARNYSMYDVWRVQGIASENMQWFLTKAMLGIRGGDLQQKDRDKIAEIHAETYSTEKGDLSHMYELFLKTLIRNPLSIVVSMGREMSKTLGGLYSTQLKMLFRGGQWKIRSFFEGDLPLWERVHLYCAHGASSRLLVMVAMMEGVWQFIRYVLIAFCVFFLIRLRKWNLLLFFLMTILCFVGMTFFDGCARYRLMIEPLLLVLTAGGAVTPFDTIRSRYKVGEIGK